MHSRKGLALKSVTPYEGKLNALKKTGILELLKGVSEKGRPEIEKHSIVKQSVQKKLPNGLKQEVKKRTRKDKRLGIRQGQVRSA